MIMEFSIAQKMDIQNILFEYDACGRLIRQSNGISFIYDHDSLIGFKYNGSRYFYRKDPFGSIVAILDNTGNVVVKYTYNALGEFMPEGENIQLALLNPFKYRGYYYDSETTLYFLKTRYYDPQIGRFISMDDVAYIDPETIGGTNLFAYCNNNPVMNVDPNGTFLFGLVVGMFLGFTGSMVQDIVDDGELFNGSVKLHQYLGNIFISGGVGAIIALGSTAIIAGLKSTGIQLAVDGITSLVTGANRFESLQEYAISFVFGGLSGYGSKKLGKLANAISMTTELVVQPIVNEVADTVFDDGTFSAEDVYTRIILNGMFEFLKMDFKRGVF